MKFDKNRFTKKAQKLDAKNLMRKKIWATPSVVEEFYGDKEWQQFDEGTVKTATPSAEMYSYIQAEIRKNDLENEQKTRKKQYTLKLLRYGSAVAASIVLLLSFGLWQWTLPKHAVSTSKIQQHHRPSVLPDVIWTSVENQSGQIKTVQLPDQSTVKLFARTKIRYPEKFSKEAREIHLSGKAYFSVHKDASRPFSVYAGGTKTTALGTSFTINTRLARYKTTIKLHTGRIVIASTLAEANFSKVYLSIKGESLSFDSRSNTIERSKLHTIQAAVIAKPSKTNLLHMDKVPLPEVFITLQDAYHLKINIGSSSIAQILYTGTINVKNETLNDALAVICLINDLRYEIEQDGSYTIYTQDHTPINKR